MSFSKEFIWGVATSSYQIEGGSYEDGKGLNIWDAFCREEGKIFDDHTGDIACDHYHRYKEDIKAMKEMGVKGYRFSLNWARILPNGTGYKNQKGIDFYNNIINELIKNDIIPYITLYHWELPYELHKKGGWLNEEIIDWFAEYAAVVAEEFSDRVKYFITLNEPQCFVGLGYLQGNHAPGLKIQIKDTFQIIHNALRAHGRAVIALREHAKKDIEIGYAPTGPMFYPATDREEDINAAREQLFSLPDDMSNWTWNVSWFSDPVFLGNYPEEGLKKYKKYLPDITKEDMKLISQPLDFMGENIYNGAMVYSGLNKEIKFVNRYIGFPKTSTGWPVTPECIYWGAKFLVERYKLPLYITENGMACHDVKSVDGRVHDPNRIDFLHRYLYGVKKAIEDGINIAGYFEWSFMDNFEWNEGYDKRFGLIYVDYTTLERTWKDSAYWYQKVIKENGENIIMNKEKEILFLNPIFVEMIWGGDRLALEYNYDIPSDKTGECWAVSAHKNGDCSIANGTFKGERLSSLWTNHRELFGNIEGDRFPLLVKIIDAKDDLSIQVHPDDSYAKKNENGSLGKTECWYILDCNEDANLIIGHNAKDKEELKQMIDKKEWNKLIRKVPIKKGDFFQIEPGTVHAITAGTLILETQQNSDITYRLYDYDRLSNGVPRELHIEKSIDVIRAPFVEKDLQRKITKEMYYTKEELVTCEYYFVDKVDIAGIQIFRNTSPFLIMSVLEGEGMINHTPIKKGDHFILPNGFGDYTLEGNISIISSGVSK